MGRSNVAGRAGDEPRRQARTSAQALLDRSCPLVGLVIVAQEVQEAVQRQNPQFDGQRMPEPPAWRRATPAAIAISPRDRGRSWDRAAPLSTGNDSTSVGRSTPRNCAVQTAHAASGTSAMPTWPFAAVGRMRTQPRPQAARGDRAAPGVGHADRQPAGASGRAAGRS